jgi:methylated-DNA-[protein]-cysteine S-methyltransferase
VDWFAVESPIGRLGVALRGDAVTGVSFRPPEARAEPELESAFLDRVRQQFAEYFAGARTEFDLPVLVTRGSEFERAVWARIAAIPYGLTASYGEVARAVGEPGGAQAVGTACNRNPLPLVVACHRVIGSDGKLVGFGGGLDRKRFLLGLEARVHIEHTFAAGLT